MQAETGDPIWKTYTEYNIRFMECWNPVSSVHHFKMSASYDSYMLVWYERSFVTVSSLYVNNSQLGSMQKNTNNNRLSFFSLSVYFFFTFLMITEDIDACNLVYSHTKFLFLLFFHFSLSTFIAFIERRCLFRFLSNKSPLIAQHFSLKLNESCEWLNFGFCVKSKIFDSQDKWEHLQHATPAIALLCQDFSM